MTVLSFLPKPAKAAVIGLAAIVSSCSPSAEHAATPLPERTNISVQGNILTIERLQKDNDQLFKAYCAGNEDEYVLLLKDGTGYQVLPEKDLTQDEDSCLYGIVKMLENQTN